MRRPVTLLFFLLIMAFAAPAQTILADSIAALQPPMEESSGLVILNNRIITLGDSGNPPALFEIDTTTGLASRTVHVARARNVDWEAAAADSTYIYIGDFGNNNGNRQDLRVYRIAIADYLNTTNDTVLADTIAFSYADQTDFTPAPLQTNYDAEALVNYRDSLYIFTKQWGKGGTSVYSLPKQPGQYTIHKIDSMQTNGLVTGGCFNIYFGFLTLTTNTPFVPYVESAYGWQPGMWNGQRTTRQIDVAGSIQVEAIAVRRFTKYFITSETSVFGPGVLSTATIQPIGQTEFRKPSVSVFPNPSTGKVRLSQPERIRRVQVFDLAGKPMIDLNEDATLHSLRFDEPGLYTVLITLKAGNQIIQKLVITP